MQGTDRHCQQQPSSLHLHVGRPGHEPKEIVDLAWSMVKDVGAQVLSQNVRSLSLMVEVQRGQTLLTQILGIANIDSQHLQVTDDFYVL